MANMDFWPSTFTCLNGTIVDANGRQSIPQVDVAPDDMGQWIASQGHAWSAVKVHHVMRTLEPIRAMFTSNVNLESRHAANKSACPTGANRLWPDADRAFPDRTYYDTFNDTLSRTWWNVEDSDSDFAIPYIQIGVHEAKKFNDTKVSVILKRTYFPVIWQKIDVPLNRNPHLGASDIVDFMTSDVDSFLIQLALTSSFDLEQAKRLFEKATHGGVRIQRQQGRRP